MRLRVGLVGLGDAWENRHRPALHALAERFEVRAVCDQVRHRAELAAAEFGATAVDGFRVLTAREDIHAILVLSLQWHGALPVLAACDCGKAVYYGTGFDLPPEEAAKLKDRVREADIAFMVEFPHRHWPATVRLKELIATELGPPRLLFCHRRMLVDEADRTGPSRSQSSMVQQLEESVDWCRYVVGREASWVTGMVHQWADDQPDYRTMSLGFYDALEPGRETVAQISCGRYIPARWREAVTYRPLAALQASCECGIAFLDMPATLIWFDEAGRHQECLESERPVGEQLLMQFYHAATNLVTRTCDLEDACRALSIVEQADNSHRQGRRIVL